MEKLKDLSIKAIFFSIVYFLISFDLYKKGTYIKNFLTLFIIYFITYPFIQMVYKIIKSKFKKS